MMSRKKTLIFLAAEVAVIVGMAGYYLWTAEKAPAACKARTARHGLITGIIYTEEKPSVVIDGEIVYEGDTIHGVKVIKIDRDRVEFKKKRKRWTQQAQEQPSRAWPKKTD